MAKRDAILVSAYETLSSQARWDTVIAQYFTPDRKNGDWWNGKCPLPSHGGRDSNPSFGINIKSGTYNCFACGSGDALDFLMNTGSMSYENARELVIRLSGVDPDKAKRKTQELTSEQKRNGYFTTKRSKTGTLEYIESYVYYSNGTPLYRKNRYEGVDSQSGERIKAFDFWVYIKGEWLPSGKAIKIETQTKVLYNRDAIANAKAAAKPVYLCEGEKDVNTLTDCGYNAVTAGGVNEWQSRFAKLFEGIEVIIVPDNDIPGDKSALRIANELFDAGTKARITDWHRVTLITGSFPGEQKEKHGEDISDLVAFISGRRRCERADAVHDAVALITNEAYIFEPSSNALENKHLIYDFEINDTGNAGRLIKLHGNDIRFCPEWNTWLHYTGFWEQDIEGHVQAKVRNTIDCLKKETQDVGDGDMIKFAVRSGNFSRIKAMLDVAKNYVEYGVPVKSRYWDGYDGLICLRNCTINARLEDNAALFEVREHRREDYITKQLPFAYDPEATCVMWQEFLAQILHDDEVRMFMQKAVGYSLTGDTAEDMIFILYGCGSNGKSTFVDVIAGMLGEYAKTIKPETLMHKENSNTPNTEIASIRGARFVRTSEADEGKRLSESVIKQLTSGEPVSARFLYGHDFEYRPTYKIWFSTNHKPIIRGSDNGIWRRICLIPFEVTIAKEDRDLSLDMKLNKEIPGIFNWALEGLMLWKKEGLLPPAKVCRAIDEYRKEQDILQDFIDDCVVSREGKSVVASKLYDRYSSYCDKNGIYKLSVTAFGRKFGDKGFIKKKTGGCNFYIDIALNEANDAFVPATDSYNPFIDDLPM